MEPVTEGMVNRGSNKIGTAGIVKGGKALRTKRGKGKEKTRAKARTREKATAKTEKGALLVSGNGKRATGNAPTADAIISV